jgi:hypothetical protein
MHIALRLVWGDMQQNGGVLSEIAKKAVIEAMSRVETIDAGVMIEPTGEEEGED